MLLFVLLPLFVAAVIVAISDLYNQSSIVLLVSFRID